MLLPYRRNLPQWLGTCHILGLHAMYVNLVWCTYNYSLVIELACSVQLHMHAGLFHHKQCVVLFWCSIVSVFALKEVVVYAWPSPRRSVTLTTSAMGCRLSKP